MPRWSIAYAMLFMLAQGCGAHRMVQQEPRSSAPLPAPPKDRTLHGKIFKQALADAIRAADRIEIVEHSSPFDFKPPRQNEPDLEYGSTQLDGATVAVFLAAADAMDDTTQSMFLACVPAYHHSIRFYEAGQLASVMKICFECSDIAWRRKNVINPQAVWPILAETVKKAGFQPHREWRDLVKGR